MIARILRMESMLPLIGLLAALGIAGNARAQFGEAAGIAEAMIPDVMSRDIAMFDKGLGLDETQRVIIEALFNDYNDAFEAGLAKMKQKFEDMRPQLVNEDEPRVLKLVFSPFAEWGRDKGKLFEQFLNNVKVVLTPEQMERWPAFERQLLRDKELSKGRLSGESIDLINILRDMHLDDSTMHAAQPAIDEYDLNMDRALRERKEMRSKMQPDMLKAMSEQDGKAGMDLFEKMIALQIAVRDVNDHSIEAIATALPAPTSQEFRQAALERGYPRIYRETPVERLFTAAKELEGLSPEVLKSVTDLQSNFLGEMTPMNESLLTELRQWDPTEQKQHAANFAAHWQGGNQEKQEDPTRDSFLKRDEMAKRYAKMLQGLLTPEQFGLLPGSYRWLTDEQTVKAVPTPKGGKQSTREAGKGRGPMAPASGNDK